MGKRKRADGDSVPGETDSSDTLPNSDTVTSISLCDTNKDEYDVWLVRKPRGIPLSDLSSIKFPHKAKNRIRVSIPSRSDAVPLNCHFHCLALPHVYIPTAGIRTQKDAMALKATNLVKGVVLVNEKFDLSDGAAVLTNDDGVTVKLESGTLLENGVHEMNFKINSIRKRPKLPPTNIKQRLKPFGIIPKKRKKSYKLPNLTNSQ
uniref:FHA_2 domain-containing protein n=1 Tax=Elaeophora elaphi TaxID=1147741 RepID=A0A0R3S224_9BILA